MPAHRTPYAVAPTTEWVRRMGAAEAAAASFATRGRLPALLNGEQSMPPEDAAGDSRTGPLGRRSTPGLACPGWRDNMVLITRTQALIAGTAMVLVTAAAADATDFDPSPRLRPALDRAGTAWVDLGSRWDDLTPFNVRPSPQLLLAAGEIRAATRALTDDGAIMATPHTIATRPGLHEGLHAVLHALEHADELAHAVAEKSTTVEANRPSPSPVHPSAQRHRSRPRRRPRRRRRVGVPHRHPRQARGRGSAAGL